MQTASKIAARHYMVLFILMLIWGSSFILMKKGLVSFSNFQVGALRISISYLVLLPFALMRIGKVWKEHRNKLKYFFIAGFLGNGIPAFLFATAQTRIDSFMAGILNSLTPLFTLLVGISFFGAKTKWSNILGVVLGLAGAIGLLAAGSGKSFSLNSAYALLAVTATLLYAFNMNIIKRYLTGFDAITITSIAFFCFGLPFVIYLFTTDFTSRLADMPGAWVSLGYIGVLAFFGTVVAVVIHNWLLRQTTALFAASVTYLMPIVAVFWGIADGEKFYPVFVLWISVILGGVYLANRPGGGFIKARRQQKILEQQKA